MSAGSSPRVRGKLYGKQDALQIVRIIPARAGQTRTTAAPPHPEADHPRACGANFFYLGVELGQCGSSPRVRGKHGSQGPYLQASRIIPARAGQTWKPTSAASTRPDHPRACGANVSDMKNSFTKDGSSPRVRGKRTAKTTQHSTERIIPARAGQTYPTPCKKQTHTDHPRACGANSTMAVLPSSAAGSSPRVRGKQSDFMRKLLSAGPSIIGFAQWLQSSCYCSCFQSSAKTPISRGTTPTSLFLGFQNSITLLLLT